MNSNIFFTEKEGKFTIPIPEEGFTTNKENSEFTDGFFVSWSYPISLFLNSELKRILGDLSNPNIQNSNFEVSGILSKFGEIFPSKMKIISARNSEAKINFEFGIASLDVMDKKLSEIDLGIINTTDLYDYIDANLFENYDDGAAVFFPRIRTPKKYNEEIGPLYGGANVFNDSNPTTNKVYRNEFTPAGQAIFNFIKPIVYGLHILKKGFESAGFELQGDILNDDELNNIGFDHNNIADEELNRDIIRIPVETYGILTKDVKIIGAFFFSMIVPNGESSVNFKVTKKATGEILYEGSKFGVEDIMYDNYGNIISIPQDLYFIQALPIFDIETEITVFIELINLFPLYTENHFFTAYFNPAGKNNKKSYFLPNNLVLNKYVPDVTFLELVTAYKNLRNYSLTIENNVVLMNEIKNTLPDKIKDFTFSEQQDVEVTPNELNGFLLRFTAPEEFGFFSYLYDKNGFVKSELKIEDEENEVREFKAYPLPFIATYRSAVDEVNEEIEGLPMIHYTGTKATNNANELLSFSLANIYSKSYKNWMIGRLNALGLKWSFSTKNPEAFQLKISDCIYAYNQYHKLKSFQERHHLNNIIEIEFTTENRY